jgi:phosphoglycolate phosphatase-like HAD superfamily hydrolase
MGLRVIVLDFDGVVVESNNIKHQAFSELFSEFPEDHSAIMAYHLSHNAVNRHEKFRHIMEHIFKQEYDKSLAAKWAAQFSALTLDRIIRCPYVDGALEFLEYFSRKYPLYLASATPLDELDIILKRRGAIKYFKRFYGAPTPKVKMLEEIARDEMINHRDILYIGDSREDYEAARAFGCIFIARNSGHELGDTDLKRFKDMSDIKTYVISCGG